MSTPILEDILQLSVSERLQLVEEIWDTIVDNPEQLPLPKAQQEEIERRIEAHDQRSRADLPWGEALDNLRVSNE
jgi:putative addiction module component (TIGR02574 family)